MTTLYTFPPEDAGPLEILRDYAGAVEIGLFTNALPTTGPRLLADYQEPTFPGYRRWSAPAWAVDYRSADGRRLIVSARARWQLLANVVPVNLRGWFATVTTATGLVHLLAEYNPGTMLTVSRGGDVVVIPLSFAVQRREVE